MTLKDRAMRRLKLGKKLHNDPRFGGKGPTPPKDDEPTMKTDSHGNWVEIPKESRSTMKNKRRRVRRRLAPPQSIDAMNKFSAWRADNKRRGRRLSTHSTPLGAVARNKEQMQREYRYKSGALKRGVLRPGEEAGWKSKPGKPKGKRLPAGRW